MVVIRNLLPLAAVLLVALTGAHAEQTQPRGVSSSSHHLREVLDGATYDIDSEFADFDKISNHRRLQNNKDNNNNSGSGGTTETAYCNTWCKLKESLGLTIVGLLLICIAPCLMWKNEGRHVNELRRIDFCKNEAQVVHNADIPSDENTGQLVHFVGKVSVDEDSLDLHPGPLNITSPLPKALIVKRTCMIYQKFEQASQQVKNDTIGAGQQTTTTYTCREDWTPMGPQAPSLPHLPNEQNVRGIWDEVVANSGTPETASPSPAAPELPPNMPPEMAALFQQVDMTKAPQAIAVSKAAHVGGFAVTKDLVMAEPAVFQSEWMPLPAEMVPEAIEEIPELRKDRYGNLTTVEEGEQPSNGDIMIKYEYAVDGFDVSFIVQQVLAESDPETGVSAHKFGVDKGRVLDEKCCGKISDDLGVIWMVRRGRHDLHDMINMAKEDEKNVTKILRVICWVLLVAGWMMLFSIFTTLLSTLPILGALGNAAFFIVALIIGTVCCCGVTAIAYMRYRPLLSFGILAIAGTITGLVFWQMDEAQAASAAPSPAPAKALAFLADDMDTIMTESVY